MLKKLSLSICILSAFLLVGCSKSETAETNSNHAANTNKAAPPASSPATTTTASTATKVGVPECDDFIAKYDACVSAHVPEAARAQYKGTLETWRSQWSKLAANPQTKASLVQACKTASDSAKTSMKSFNCTF